MALPILPDEQFDAIVIRLRTGGRDRADLRAAVKHTLGLLVAKAPGSSVEVRVPPYAVAQCIPGARHTRGTPPAVVETDALTWIALATGEQPWADCIAAGSVRASGERSDLSRYLPVARTETHHMRSFEHKEL